MLVVDDEPFVARALAIFLGDEHEVTIVHDARMALARLEDEETFDAILCDVMMAGMSGVDFHRTLLASPVAHIARHAERVVFITGGAFTATAREYLASVSNDCVDKPPDPFILRALMRRMVAQHVPGADDDESEIA